MIASAKMAGKTSILCVIGPTASGKSSRGVQEALLRGGEIISMDSRQVYRGLDIGTEKITTEEMCGVPHYLIDIRDPNEHYSAGDFLEDASRLINEIAARGNLPLLVGGTHFYLDALLYGLPEGASNEKLREELEFLTTEELYRKIEAKDKRRALELDPKNRRRLVRALELIETHGEVPRREQSEARYEVSSVVLNPPMKELQERIETRLLEALAKGLVDEVREVREQVGDRRLNELGLEYKVVGEYLRSEREEQTLFPALLSKLTQYARRQKAWLRKLAL